MKVGVVGLGYVGLPLAIAFAKAELQVVGLDIDPAKVEAINKGESYIKHIQNAQILKRLFCGLPGQRGNEKIF